MRRLKGVCFSRVLWGISVSICKSTDEDVSTPAYVVATSLTSLSERQLVQPVRSINRFANVRSNSRFSCKTYAR